MANGMGYTEHSFGFRPVPRRPTPPRPNDRPGPMGANPPFPSLTAPSAPPITPVAPSGGGIQPAAAPQAPQPGPAQPQQPAPQPLQAPAAPQLSYDYNTDPVLQQIMALSVQDRSAAQSSALAAKKQLAIDYGDPNLANQLGDPATAQAAAGNQFSVLANLAHQYTQGQTNLDEQLNNQNLFYSGDRVLQQGNLTHDYQGQQAGALGQEQGLLTGIGSGLQQALSAADQRDMAAQQAAQQQALQVALANQQATLAQQAMQAQFDQQAQQYSQYATPDQGVAAALAQPQPDMSLDPAIQAAMGAQQQPASDPISLILLHLLRGRDPGGM